MMSCSFGEVRAYRNAARVPGQFKRPLSPELWLSADRVVLSADIGLVMNLHGLPIVFVSRAVSPGYQCYIFTLFISILNWHEEWPLNLNCRLEFSSVFCLGGKAVVVLRNGMSSFLLLRFPRIWF